MNSQWLSWSCESLSERCWVPLPWKTHLTLLWLWDGSCGNQDMREGWGSILLGPSQHQLVLTQLFFLITLKWDPVRLHSGLRFCHLQIWSETQLCPATARTSDRCAGYRAKHSLFFFWPERSLQMEMWAINSSGPGRKQGCRMQFSAECTQERVIDSTGL